MNLFTFKPLPAPQGGAVSIGQYNAHRYLTARIQEHNDRVAWRWVLLVAVVWGFVVGAVLGVVV